MRTPSKGHWKFARVRTWCQTTNKSRLFYGPKWCQGNTVQRTICRWSSQYWHGLCVKQARPLSLNDAVRHAVELKAFNKAERKRDEGRGYLRSTSQTIETQECDSHTLTQIKSMQTVLSELQQEVKSLKDECWFKTSAYKQRDLSKTKFYSCGSLGHSKILHDVCQWLATGRWFSPGSPVSSTNKTDHHDIIEILLKVALSTIKKQTNKTNSPSITLTSNS